MSITETINHASSAVPPQDEKRFRSMWGQLFGDASVQVYFVDAELNARVYTLDGESGYKVQHKKVGGTNPVEEPEDAASQRLAFPKKARRGEKHGRAQLGEDDVRSIRAWAAELAARKETPAWTAKAKELNVSEGTLRDIVSRRTWTHLASEAPILPPRTRLEDHEVIAIRDWIAEEELKPGTPDFAGKAREFGVTEGTIRDVVTRRSRTRLPGGSTPQSRIKLDEGEVRAIREWAAQAAKNDETPDWAAKAKELNVSEQTVRRVVNGETWAQVD